MFALPSSIPATSGTSVQTDSAARHTKLVKAAQQFEAVMLGELMKPLGKNTAIGGSDDEQGSNALQGYSVEAMAGAMARSGALGFANRIVASVEKHDPKNISEKSANAAKVPNNSVDKPSGGI
jgi:flagellar protein FlgJ